MADFYQAAWGPLTLWCSEITSEGGRSLVVHELASGDDHPVSDRGQAPRTFSVTLLFDDFPGESEKPLDRFLRFKAKVDAGDEDMFVHPIEGAVLAKVGTFSYKHDEDSNIVDVTAEFRPTQPIRAVLQPGLGRLPSVGVDAVQARADELNAQLEKVDLFDEMLAAGIDDDFVTIAAALPTVWADTEDISTRAILVDVAHVTNQIATLTSILEDDIALFDAYKSTILFGAAFAAAAQAATSETPAVFTMRVGTPTSVLGLVTRVYGGTDSDLRERQVRSLNDLRTPGGLIPTGTELVMPAVPVRGAA